MTTTYAEARRELGITGAVEKRVLLWLAARVPAAVQPDHLTALGFAATMACGLSYAGAGAHRGLLLAASLFLVANWLGDSLDGTLARYRRRPRPRYGFYLDHLVDALGATYVIGGIAASGLLGERLALLVLVAYLVLTVHIVLAAHTAGVFRIAVGPIGGTELRLLAIAGNAALFAWDPAPGTTRLVADLVGLAVLTVLGTAVARSGIRTARRLAVLDGAGASFGAPALRPRGART